MIRRQVLAVSMVIAAIGCCEARGPLDRIVAELETSSGASAEALARCYVRATKLPACEQPQYWIPVAASAKKPWTKTFAYTMFFRRWVACDQPLSQLIKKYEIADWFKKEHLIDMEEAQSITVNAVFDTKEYLVVAMQAPQSHTAVIGVLLVLEPKVSVDELVEAIDTGSGQRFRLVGVFTKDADGGRMCARGIGYRYALDEGLWVPLR